MEIAMLILALLVMAVGLVGSFLPMIPGVPLVYSGYLIYGLASGWRHYGLGIMVAFGLVTVLVIVLDYVAGSMGAKKFGASRAGAWGAIIGAVVGVLTFNLIGLVVGTFGGAVLGELLLGRTMGEAFRSGWGAFLGFLAGSLFKVMAATIMLGSFLWLVFI
jgi:hypothetical protein